MMTGLPVSPKRPAADNGIAGISLSVPPKEKVTSSVSAAILDAAFRICSPSGTSGSEFLAPSGAAPAAIGRSGVKSRNANQPLNAALPATRRRVIWQLTFRSQASCDIADDTTHTAAAWAHLVLG